VALLQSDFYMRFDIVGFDGQSKARAESWKQAHGNIETPIFMPVGTAGTVKAVHQRELKNDIKAQIILGNTIIFTCAPGSNFLNAPADYINLMAGRGRCSLIVVAIRYILWLMSVK
jgi:tRNA-guanine family transglycosylase